MAKFAIIIPVWHHPVLVDEAILSCLNQENADDFQIIVINDGCDMAQTRASLEGWKAAYPHRITLLNQANRGLSAARNTGIEQALKNPDIQAMFFLDADNCLDPHSVALFSKLLESDKNAGWFYPQVDMSGMEVNYSNGGKFLLSRLASINFADAGSLIRRNVFDAGLRFDPAFKVGFEDWDFWLSAVKAGFYGAPVMESFFRYRKRPESMVVAAMRKDAQLRGQLRDKHAWLYDNNILPQAWNEEWPRFVLISTDGGQSIGSDPSNQTVLTRTEIISQIYAKRANPAEFQFPDMLVFYQPEVLECLRDAKILDSCLYQLEGALRQSPMAVLNLSKGPRSVRLGAKQRDETGEILMAGQMIAVSMHHIFAALDQPEMEDIIEYLVDNVPVTPLNVQIPNALITEGSALEAMIDLIGSMILSPIGVVPARQYANWRSPVFAPMRIDVANSNAGGRPALAAKSAGKHVGFVIPLFHFGGIEKCAVALARELTKQGVTCHLFIYGDSQADAAEWMFAPFEKVWILTDPAMRDWNGGGYLGSSGPEYPGKVMIGDVLGPLTFMDVVINCGAGILHHGLASLKKRGVKTATWEHLSESTVYGRSYGTPYMTVGYEAGYDHILTCSEQLLARMAGLGVPRSKLLALPNGSGYVGSGGPERAIRAENLRVGFLGRFDRQKGIDRFVEIATALRQLDFDVKMCGGSVIDNDAMPLPDWLDRCGPLTDPAELDAFYASIDVLVMPSRDEGLPLTILEAQRAGVVPIVSDVGAVSEAITDGHDGILLPPDAVIESAVTCLKELSANREKLLKLSQNAAGKPDNWLGNAAAFVKAVFD